jgi:nucleotide-binding universal stress UspA family protein
MLGLHAPATQRRRSVQLPFPRILCAAGDGVEALAAIEQATAIAGDEARLEFAGPESAAALLAATARHDLIVVGAHPDARATGILLGETAAQLVHRCPIPVLVARPRPPETGILAATRARPADRAALIAGARVARRLGTELTVIHVAEREDDFRRGDLSAELASARALLGRGIDYLTETGPPAHAIVARAEADGAGLVVVSSAGRRALPTLERVSERVAHLAPCSVLVMRGE